MPTPSAGPRAPQPPPDPPFFFGVADLVGVSTRGAVGLAVVVADAGCVVGVSDAPVLTRVLPVVDVAPDDSVYS